LHRPVLVANDSFDLLGVHESLRVWLCTSRRAAAGACVDPALEPRLLERCEQASALAWPESDAEHEPAARAVARLDTQRALYEVNRRRFYWFDEPSAYASERSPVLLALQERLERPWQRWLARRVPEEGLDAEDPRAVLLSWVARDREPADGQDWFSLHASLAGYRRLLEIVSLNGLIEASQLSRVMGGPAHPVRATLFRILMEEYGAGRLHKKHSHFFARMLEAQGLSTEPEAYLARVPWQVLSAINHSFHLTENVRHYLRFCGAFTYTELSTPVGFHGYATAARRLGLSDGHDDYWALHVREDDRHGTWMVDEVALPLLAQYPQHARDVLFGYAQQRVVEAMAGEATEQACREAQEARDPA
jgi:hypothetical protein